MKKIFISIVAVAALAACSKSEVAYEPTDEIGFSVVAGNITKSVVDGNVYPTSLGMYVFAETTDNTEAEANYILNGLFIHRDTKVEGTDVWGGSTPYYWPNIKTLHFAGYSDAGNVNGSYNCQTGVLSISNYTPKKGATAEDEGVIDENETELLQSALEFTDLDAGDILTPRIDVVGFEINDSIDEILSVITESQFSRYPVYERTVDHVVGILYVKHLLKELAGKETVNLRELLLEPVFIPKSMHLHEIMNEFRSHRVHMAVVADEYGGVALLISDENETAVINIFCRRNRSAPAQVESASGGGRNRFRKSRREVLPSPVHDINHRKE